MMKILNIAHRGIWDETIPQNTVEAFRQAWADGATWVETDFHRTSSGQMLCIHAEGELRSYTGCERRIVDLSPEEAAALRLVPPRGGAFRIPTLSEVLATVPAHGTLQAEIKSYAPDYPELFDDAVRAAGLSEKNIVVSSFDYEALADFRRRLPKYRTLWLTGLPGSMVFDPETWIGKCRAAGFDAFCPGAKDAIAVMTPADADAIRAAGISFRVYGVNSPETLKAVAPLSPAAFTCNFWHAAFEWARAVDGLELIA